jgi:hypothetical protein
VRGCARLPRQPSLIAEVASDACSGCACRNLALLLPLDFGHTSLQELHTMVTIAAPQPDTPTTVTNAEASVVQVLLDEDDEVCPHCPHSPHEAWLLPGHLSTVLTFPSDRLPHSYIHMCVSCLGSTLWVYGARRSMRWATTSRCSTSCRAHNPPTAPPTRSPTSAEKDRRGTRGAHGCSGRHRACWASGCVSHPACARSNEAHSFAANRERRRVNQRGEMSLTA